MVIVLDDIYGERKRESERQRQRERERKKERKKKERKKERKKKRKKEGGKRIVIFLCWALLFSCSKLVSTIDYRWEYKP